MFNLIICVYLWWLGAEFATWKQAVERCTQYIFRTYADLILVGFSHHIYRKLLPKRKATNLKKMEKNCSENFQRHFSDISNLMTILNRKLIIIDNRKPKNCVKSQILPKVRIMKLENQWKTKTKRKLEYGIRETREKPNFAENCNRKPILYLI